MRKSMQLSVLLLGVGALSACGGSETGGGDPLIVDPNDNVVDIVVATGSDSLNDAETFPMYYSLVTQSGEQAAVQVGRGRLDVVDADTITFTREADGASFTFTATTSGSPEYTGTVAGETVTLNLAEGSGTVLAFLRGDVADNGFGLAGVYGFETPTGNLPSGNVTYNGRLGTAFVVESGSSEAIQLTQSADSNTASLVVEFGTLGVTGTIFDGSGFVDLEDDGTSDDQLDVLVTIENGSVASGKITGNLSLDANVTLSGGGSPVDLAPTVSSSQVDAAVFGNTGNVVGGTFEGDGAFNLDSEQIDFGLGGTFFSVSP